MGGYAPDTGMSCNNSCNGASASAAKCGSCMQIRNNESDCALDTPGCARQVAYGGYVKSKVLIQCYATIDEGCQQLPTKYEAVSATMQNQNKQSGPKGDGSGFYTCEQLCAMDNKNCKCKSEGSFLKVNNLFPKGAETHAACMRNKFAN